MGYILVHFCINFFCFGYVRYYLVMSYFSYVILLFSQMWVILHNKCIEVAHIFLNSVLTRACYHFNFVRDHLRFI